MENYSHYDDSGRPMMIDVGRKERTIRRAVAECFIELPEAVYKALNGGDVAKGDPMRVTELGGIMGAKRTPNLIPLCHPINLEAVNVKCELMHNQLRIECEVSARGATGVEMEALVGVTVAALVFYDMCKALDKGIVIKEARLLEKSGGESGNWKQESGKAESEEPDFAETSVPAEMLHSVRTGVLTVSDKASRGEKADTSGPALAGMARAMGLVVERLGILPDDRTLISDKLKGWADNDDLDLILVTGGTGLSVRDVTPEALMDIHDKVVPGFGETMRTHATRYTRHGLLSRGLAITRGSTLIVALPGSERGVRQCFEAISPALRHGIGTLRGWDSACGH